jgi:RNA ligase (TIGR02306 family)
MSSLIVEACRISSVEHHPNADRLDIAQIKGFQAIVGRDEYKAGDLVVYVPPDCVIPDKLVDELGLEYLKSSSGVSRTKAIKLRGYLSEGLVLNVPAGLYATEGIDMADAFGITKYEPPQKQFIGQPRQPTKRRLNPNFEKYTDIENFKHYTDIFKPEDMVVITEKVHGSNFRAARLERWTGKGWRGLLNRILMRLNLADRYEFVYGSHNVQISGNFRYKGFYSEDIYGRVAEKYRLEEQIPADYTIYGEVYGYEVQDLEYGLTNGEVDLLVLDVKVDGSYLPHFALEEFCEARGLPLAPVLFLGRMGDAHQLETLRDGKSVLCPSQIREGCVIKDFWEDKHPRIGRRILKCISPDYLTRKNGTENH